MKRYTVVLIPEAEEGGYSVTVPAEEGAPIPEDETLVYEHVEVAVA